MKIAFIWYFNKARQVYDNWHDGHRAAIGYIAKQHTVDWFLDKELPDKGVYDFLLFWSSSNENYFDVLNKYSEPKGICLTTNPHNTENLRKMSIVFVESQPIYDECRALGLPVIKAFGTDTDFFTPDASVKKDIPYFYPATFSQWKMQRAIAHLGKNLWLVGTIQSDGNIHHSACKRAGCHIEVGYFPATHIRSLYQHARKVVIPAIHGSERTVLEAMSMNIVPEIVYPDVNKKAYSYIAEYNTSTASTPREFVINNYSHKVFAKNLLKGIEI